MKVGDLVTGYYAGWWRITKIEDRSKLKGLNRTDSPLVYMELVMDTRYSKPKKSARKKCCDAAYIKVWDESTLEAFLKNSLDKIQKDVTIMTIGINELKQEVR